MINGHILVSEWSTKLALAAELQNDFAPHLNLPGTMVLRLIGDDYDWSNDQPSRAGFYLFRDVPDGAYNLEMKHDYYQEVSQPITLPMPDATNPVLRLSLVPSAKYPMPEATALIGKVLDQNGSRLAEVEATVQDKDASDAKIMAKTKTGELGTFAVYFAKFDAPTQNLFVKLSKKNEGEETPVTIVVPVVITKNRVALQTFSFS